MGLDEYGLLPREKALKFGIDKLSEEELLAVLISKGTKDINVMDLSKLLMKQYISLENLSLLSIEELCKIRGINKVKAIQLLSVFEIHRRIILESNNRIVFIKSAYDVFNYVKPYLYNIKVEKFFIILLSQTCKLINFKEISTGTSSQIVFSCQDILSHVLSSSVRKYIIVHNHPSTNINPSNHDIESTNRLKMLSSMMGIDLIDHYIIGENKIYSMNENNVYEI